MIEIAERQVEAPRPEIVATPVSAILLSGNKAVKKYTKDFVNCGILGDFAIDAGWEIRFQRLFKSRHSFAITGATDCSYSMPRFLTALGDYKQVSPEGLKKMLFFISVKELFFQLDEIGSDLERCCLSHHDLHPGNLFFSEEERLLKLGDFFWCNKQELSARAGINMLYGNDDKEAIQAIKSDITDILCGNGESRASSVYLLAKKERYLIENFSLIKKDKKYLFNFYKMLGKDFMPVDKFKSRKYLLKALSIKPLSFSVVGKLVRN
jgi:hypothetical protein